jgi:type IV pilus assembly protein PilV
MTPGSGTAVANSLSSKKEDAMTKISRFRLKLGGQKGFTILEVLVAMIVLAIGLLGLAPMFVMSMRGNQFSREVSETAYLAQDRIEQLKNQSIISPIPFNETAASGSYTRTVNVSDQTVDGTIPPGVYRINVTLSWTDKQGRSHSTSYVTYKVK